MVGDSKKDRKEHLAYLDLLASVLTEHEKTLDNIIEKLKGITETLMEITQSAGVERLIEYKPKTPKTLPETSETLTYIKIKISRPTEEIKKILESLKD